MQKGVPRNKKGERGRDIVNLHHVHIRKLAEMVLQKTSNVKSKKGEVCVIKRFFLRTLVVDTYSNTVNQRKVFRCYFFSFQELTT